MVDAFYLFYISWLESDLRDIYKDDIQALYNKYNLNKSGINKIKEINRNFKKKSLTEDGKDRKQRIIEKLIYKHKSLILISNCYLTILPLFKSMVLVFEQKEPQVHKLHDMMVNNLRSFLACFMKYEVIKNLSAKQLKKVNILDNVRSSRSFFVGDSNEHIINDMLKDKNDREIVKEFRENLTSAYTEAGVYLQKKYAIDNELLINLSALDPIVRGHSKTHSCLLKLLPYFSFTLSSNDQYTAEISAYQIDKELHYFEPGSRLDSWWNNVFKTCKYPSLSKVVKAALSIFTGPQIEASFSMMNDIIDKRSSRMDVATYGAIMNVKYGLIAKGKSSFQNYHRRNVLRDPVDHILAYNMRTANALQHQRDQTKKKNLKYRPLTIEKQSVKKKKRRKGRGKSKFDQVHSKAADVTEEINKSVGTNVKQSSKNSEKNVKTSAKKVVESGTKRKDGSGDTLFLPAPKKVKQVSLMSFFKK